MPRIRNEEDLKKMKEFEQGFLEKKFELFNYSNLGNIRTYVDENGTKWFCLKDICNILGLNADDINKVTKRIPEPYQSTVLVGVQTGTKADGSPSKQNMNMHFVNETGLYITIGNSRKPEAKKVMDWIYSDVMPKLNKQGYYVMENKPLIELMRDMLDRFYELKEFVVDSIREKDLIALITSKDKVRINNYAKYKGLPINQDMAKYLGKKATQISVERDVAIANEEHEEFGTVHLYRRDIVQYVFDNFYTEALQIYGNKGDE